MKIRLAIDGAMSDLVSILSDYGVILTVQSAALELPIKLRVSRQPIWSVLTSAAAQVSPTALVTIRDSGVFYVGEPDDQDLGVRVFPLSGLSADDFAQMIQTAGTRSVKVASLPDRLVVRDTFKGLARISQVINQLQTPSSQWLACAHFLEISESDVDTLGVDIQHALQLSASPNPSTVLSGAQVALLLKASGSGSKLRLVSSARLHVVEGVPSTMQLGDTIPVPQRSISPEGTSTVTGFSNVNSGIILNVDLRTISSEFVRVACSPEISDIVGTVEGGAPILAKRTLTVQAIIRPGSAILLGGFTTDRDTSTLAGGLPFLRMPAMGVKTDRRDRSRLFVVLQVLAPAGTIVQPPEIVNPDFVPAP